MRIINEDELIRVIEEQVVPIDESFSRRVTVYSDRIEVSDNFTTS